MRVHILLLLFLLGCASSEPATVPVIGEPQDLTPLTGEWAGTYESRASGRSGSITFHLTENPKGAHGDVIFTPRMDVVVNDGRLQPQMSSAAVLNIEFVRISAGEVSGRIEPYPDPENAGAMLETHFSGHVTGDEIEGTFVTYSTAGVAPRRGTWTVERMSRR